MTDRFCIECGKHHNTGVENRLNGDFDPIDKCIDCLMSKCSFEFVKQQVTLDYINHLSREEMQIELGQTFLKIINDSWNKND